MSKSPIEYRGTKAVATGRSRSRHTGDEAIRYFWATLLGISGLLDIVATTLPQMLESPEVCIDEPLSQTCLLPKINSDQLSPWLFDLISWLDRHYVTISLMFSVVWFMDAFVKAGEASSRVKEKRRNALIYPEKGKRVRSNWLESLFVFYYAVTFQLLVLPVGFYFMFFRCVGKAAKDTDDHFAQDAMCVKDGDYIHFDSFSFHSRQAFLVVIFEYITVPAFGITSREVKGKILNFRKAQLRRLVRRAVRNPRKFRRQLKQFLTYVRYAKALLPLIGPLNKLRVNILETYQKWRQRREAKRAKKIRALIWGKRSEKLNDEDAATRIQNAFRTHQARKATLVLEHFQKDKEHVAVARIQRQLRRWLQRTRKRIRVKKEEIHYLQRKGRLSAVESMRLYELQDQLLQETRDIIDKRMLIRPNRGFVVYWKFLFVFCVLLEVVQKSAKSFFQIHVKGSRKDILEYIEHKFVPKRISELPVCVQRDGQAQIGGKNESALPIEGFAGSDKPWYCTRPVVEKQEFFRDLVALAIVPAPVVEWKVCTPPKKRLLSRKQPWSMPWYCKEPYASVHRRYRTIMDFLWERFLVIVGLICFLDVFITFFIGEFDPEDGTLVPKPFVKRWIIPGLALQLLVNPQMEDVSFWVWETLERILDNGPVRVYRWSVTVVFPLVYGLSNVLFNHLWPRFVAFANAQRVNGAPAYPSDWILND